MQYNFIETLVQNIEIIIIKKKNPHTIFKRENKNNKSLT